MKMKKSIRYIGIIIALSLSVFLGYKYGDYKDAKDLPVYESQSLYPDLEFEEIVHMADTIVYGKVVGIGESYYEDLPVSITEDPKEVTDHLKNLVTPIEIEVKTGLKGAKKKIVTCLEEGGITDTFIQKPSGYSLEKNMEVIIFLNEKGYTWGELSIFPIYGEKVILNEVAQEFIDDSKIVKGDTNKVDKALKKQIQDKEIYVMDKKDFMAVIEGLIN